MIVFICFLSLYLLIIASAYINVAFNEYLQLQQFYYLANGSYWQWDPDYAKKGVPWNFQNYTKYNPCQQLWQGVYCYINYPDETIGNIFSFELSGFNLTGILPESIDDFPMLSFFSVDSNHLTGKIPIFNNTPSLITVNVSNNALSGSIPDNFVNISYPRLSSITLSNNYLSGTLPSVLYHLSNQLQSLNLYNNSFVGLISEEIGNLQNLFYLNLGENKFHGSLPAKSLSGLSKLQQLFLHNNQFSGPLPPTLGNYVNSLWLNGNYLTGSIPTEYSLLTNLSVLKLESNFLTGSLPSSSGRISLLSVLQVQNNQLSGSLTNHFRPDNFPSLTVIDLSDNAFSGSFPVEIFQLPILKTIAATQNCFVGRISDAVCSAVDNPIEVVALDGLHSSAYCNRSPFSRLMSGSLPGCLWRLPNITTLHFAGNGFTGTLPEVLTDFPQSLVDISLSRNRLTGTVPAFLMNDPLLSSLDLSYNKLYGSIDNAPSSSFVVSSNEKAEDASLNLENNRLSGLIPSSLVQTENVQVLQGNIFDCSSKEPENDPSKKSYICGSKDLDTASITFVTVFAGFALVVVFLVGILVQLNSPKLGTKSFAEKELPYSVRFLQFLRKGYQWCYYTFTALLRVQDMINKTYRARLIDDESQTMVLKYVNVYQFLHALFLIQKLSILIAGFTIILCCPVYLLFGSFGSANYTKYEKTYSWIGTSTYLTGDTPAITLLVLWYATVLGVLVMVYRHYYRCSRKYSSYIKFPSCFRSLDVNKTTSIYSPLNQSELHSEIMDDRQQEQNLETNSNQLLNPASSVMSDLGNKMEANNHVQYYCLYSSLILINAVVSIIINAVYLLLIAPSSNFTSVGKEYLQGLIAIVLLVWNAFGLRIMVHRLQLFRRSVTRLHALLLVFNLVVAPCITIAITDSSCFNSVFFAAETIPGASYDYLVCTESIQTTNPLGQPYVTCINYASLSFETEYTPPFIYYYSCGSKLLAAYIPVYIYGYTFLLFASLCLYLFITPELFRRTVDSALRAKEEAGRFIISESLMNGQTIQAALTSQILVLLTFGVNSPILAVIMALAITGNCGIWQLLIVQYIKNDPCCQDAVSSDSGLTSSLTVSSTGTDKEKRRMSGSHPSLLSSSLLGVENVSDITNSNNSVPKLPSDMMTVMNSTSQQSQPSQGKKEAHNFISSSVNVADTDLRSVVHSLKEPDQDEEANNSLQSDLCDPPDFFHRDTAEEETRLKVLDIILDKDAWLCAYQTRWIILCVSLVFYLLILFDFAGDQQNAMYVLWVPSVIIGLILITRLFLIDTLQYLLS